MITVTETKQTGMRKFRERFLRLNSSITLSNVYKFNHHCGLRASL